MQQKSNKVRNTIVHVLIWCAVAAIGYATFISNEPEERFEDPIIEHSEIR